MTGSHHPAFDKELYDACMKQADYFAGRWDSRRGFEWKFSISLWTLLAIGSGFLAGKGSVHYWVVAVPTLLHYRWLRGVWIANDADKRTGRHFLERAQNAIGFGSAAERPAPKPWYRFFTDWSMSFQLLCTILLSFVLVFLNHMPIIQQAPCR